MDDGQFALPQTEGLTKLFIQLATKTHTHNLLLIPLTADLKIIILINEATGKCAWSSYTSPCITTACIPLHSSSESV
jgi:hypothetical protein